MEISLQSKVNYKKVFKQRQEMIFKEKLHIEDELNYEKFKELYLKYGTEYSEKDFAKYFLDIGTNKFYCLESGKSKKTYILLREYVSDKEIKEIRDEILSNYEFDKKINYDYLEELYLKHYSKLSLSMFAEEVFELHPHTVENIKSNRSKEGSIFKNPLDKEKIARIKNKVVRESGLHLDQEITKEQFYEVYEKFGEDLDDSIFARKVLEIPYSSFNTLKRGRTKKVAVFSRYKVDPDEIEKLREKVIEEENLHFEDLISNKRFKELFAKYAGILSEVMFAEEILDVSAVSVKNMRVAGASAIILANVEIPEEYIYELRSKIVKEKRLEQNQLVSHKQIKELYMEYGGRLSEKQFVTLILDTPILNYNSLTCGANERISILRNQVVTDFEKLRRQVIRENNLHYNDKINYLKFSELHKKYAPNMPEYVFAEKILDINHSGVNNIRFGKGKSYTYILTKEILPTEEELKKIKKEVLKNYHLHTKDEIDIIKFNEMHEKYGGIVPDYMFAEKILDIKKTELARIRNHKGETTKVLLQTSMSEEEVQQLKKKVIDENNLYVAQPIELEEFYDLYNKYNHILTENEFAKKVLGVNAQCLNKLKRRRL